MRAASDRMTAKAAQRRVEMRQRMEILRERVRLLSGTDRVLMEMYLDKGNTFRQMAVLAGVSEAAIARRIRKIIKRLGDGAYVMCLGQAELFSREELAMVRDYFIRGLSLRQIAEEHGCSFYRARRTIGRARRLLAKWSGSSGD